MEKILHFQIFKICLKMHTGDKTELKILLCITSLILTLQIKGIGRLQREGCKCLRQHYYEC